VRVGKRRAYQLARKKDQTRNVGNNIIRFLWSTPNQIHRGLPFPILIFHVAIEFSWPTCRSDLPDVCVVDATILMRYAMTRITHLIRGIGRFRTGEKTTSTVQSRFSIFVCFPLSPLFILRRPQWLLT
jgi:hypothetical protein